MTALSNLRGIARSAFERLPESVRQDMQKKRVARRQMKGLGQIKINQALMAKKIVELERRLAWQNQPTPEEVPDPRFPDGIRSRVCISTHIDEPWFTKWCDAMGEPAVPHRKSWEFAYIAHVLDSTGMLEPGRRGLGFGVGREPLAAAFAARGAQVLGTDLAAEAREVLGWAHSDQHASNVEAMQRPATCDPERFRELVTWRAVDMRNIPDDLRGFDFCWSACSLEHLGTLEAGWDFVKRSVETLAPGGIAVHTTEYNLTSNDETVEAGPTVIYRERDVIRLKNELEADGHEVAALDLRRGEAFLDQYVDVPPWADEPVLRFLLGTYTLTSVAIVVRAGGR
jgi:SAM-dependent methyltransferase